MYQQKFRIINESAANQTTLGSVKNSVCLKIDSSGLVCVIFQIPDPPSMTINSLLGVYSLSQTTFLYRLDTGLVWVVVGAAVLEGAVGYT